MAGGGRVLRACTVESRFLDNFQNAFSTEETNVVMRVRRVFLGKLDGKVYRRVVKFFRCWSCRRTLLTTVFNGENNAHGRHCAYEKRRFRSSAYGVTRVRAFNFVSNVCRTRSVSIGDSSVPISVENLFVVPKFLFRRLAHWLWARRILVRQDSASLQDGLSPRILVYAFSFFRHYTLKDFQTFK